MRGAVGLSLAFAVQLSAAHASAADQVVEARADYDAAAAAYDRADYATAAVHFARADERVPNTRALHLAMASALLASDPGVAMNLVERSEERARGEAPDPAVTELTRKLRRRFETAAGKIRVSCPSDAACRASVDGDAIDVARPRWVAPGEHAVSLETGTGGVPVTRKITVRAGETVEVGGARVGPDAVAVAAPEPRVAPASAGDDTRSIPVQRAGLPPAFFWTGVAATGVALGTSAILTVVVANRHDDFVQRPSAETAEAGDAAQARARIAWGVTGAFAITTVVLGVLTDFGGSERGHARASSPSPRCAVNVGPLAASVAGTFW